MEVVVYKDGKGLEERQWSFTPLLFHSLAFVENQFPEGGFVTFTLEANGQIHAIIHFYVTKELWSNLPRSPFGGVSVGDAVGKNELQLLVSAIFLESNGVALEFTLPFVNYPQTLSACFRDLLQEQGLVARYNDIQHFVALDASSLGSKMHKSQVRRLEKCEKASYVFAEEPIQEMPAIFAFIELCRLEQGIPLNITLAHINKSVENLPGVYRLFSVRDKGELIAACITTHVSDEVLYYFLPATAKAYSSSSPMVMLLAGLYQWAYAKNYKLLDLGRTSIAGVPQKGLCTFKERMGGQQGSLAYYVRP